MKIYTVVDEDSESDGKYFCHKDNALRHLCKRHIRPWVRDLWKDDERQETSRKAILGATRGMMSERECKEVIRLFNKEVSDPSWPKPFSIQTLKVCDDQEPKVRPA